MTGGLFFNLLHEILQKKDEIKNSSVFRLDIKIKGKLLYFLSCSFHT